MTVTLYSLPNCGQCYATKSDLTRRGIEFDLVMINEDESAASFVKELGYSAAPVVVVENDGEKTHWTGFKPQNISKLAA